MSTIKIFGMTDDQVEPIIHLFGGGVISRVKNTEDECNMYVADQFRIKWKDKAGILLESSPSRNSFEWEPSDLTVTDLLSLKFKCESEFRYPFATMIVNLVDNPDYTACSEANPYCEYRVIDGELCVRSLDVGSADDGKVMWLIADIPTSVMKSKWAIFNESDEVI